MAYRFDAGRGNCKNASGGKNALTPRSGAHPVASGGLKYPSWLAENNKNSQPTVGHLSPKPLRPGTGSQPSSPRSSPKPSPRSSPNPSPRSSPNPSPRLSPNPSPRSSPKPSPRSSPNPSPRSSPNPSPRSSPNPSPSPRLSPNPSPSPHLSPKPPARPEANGQHFGKDEISTGKSGWLEKYSGTIFKSWKKRYCVLKNNGEFTISEEQNQEKADTTILMHWNCKEVAVGSACGEIHLPKGQSNADSLFCIKTKQGKDYFFFAASVTECNEWVAVLERERKVNNSNSPNASQAAYPTQQFANSTQNGGQPMQQQPMQHVYLLPESNEQSSDEKMIEAMGGMAMASMISKRGGFGKGGGGFGRGGGGFVKMGGGFGKRGGGKGHHHGSHHSDSDDDDRFGHHDGYGHHEGFGHHDGYGHHEGFGHHNGYGHHDDNFGHHDDNFGRHDGYCQNDGSCHPQGFVHTEDGYRHPEGVPQNDGFSKQYFGLHDRF